MAQELKWSKRERDKQIKAAAAYIGEFGGPIADKSNAKLKMATYTDLREVFRNIDTDGSGYLDEAELDKASIKLGFPFRSKEELHAKFKEIDADGNGRISESEFIEWWNGRNAEKFEKKLRQQVSMTAVDEVALEKLLKASEEEKKQKK